MTNPDRWASAFNAVPGYWKLAAVLLLGGFVYALIQKWRPRK